MNQTNTTTLVRTTSLGRDVGAHRKAYLDTYARRRSGIMSDEQSTVAQDPVTQVEQAPIYYTPNQSQVVTQPAVVAVPTLVSAPSPVGVQPVRVTAPVTVATQQRRVCLDTLVKSYQHKVATAPLAEETVIQPVVTDATQHLIDPDSHSRMSANLDALYNQLPLTAQIEKNKTSASAAHVRTIVASALACGILSVSIFAFTTKYDSQPVVAQPIGSPVIEVEAPINAAPTGTPVASKNESVVHADPNDPVRLIASSIGINARIDGLGTTPEGLIAVPKSYGTVGWYNKGSTPGKSGPAVLVGHYTGGYGGVFDKLQDLKDGDLITVKNGKGQAFTYRVTKKAQYQKDQVPMAEIFKKSDASRLEIITCAGKWQSNTYDNRLVVSAELV